MTKKKAPGELKQRGPKPISYDNGDLRSELAGVQHLNQLTDEARRAIRNTIDEYFEKNSKRKTYSAKNILFLVCNLGIVNNETIKKAIDFYDKFDKSDYGDSSVRDYRNVVISVCKALQAILLSSKPIRVDTKDGAEYLSGEEGYKLRNAIDKGVTKNELLKIIKTIYPEL